MKESHITRLHLWTTLLVCFIAAAASGQEWMSRPVEPTTSLEQSGFKGDRYDGYVFLDADGDPLPFQSDSAIESFLVTAKIESMSKIPVGVSDPRKLLLSADGIQLNAIFKDIDEEKKKVREKTAGKVRFYFRWRDWYGYDIAAYHVDRLLDLDRVPPVIERKVKGQPGSVQIWIQGVITRAEKHKDDLKPPDLARWNQQKNTLYIFDSLVANRDSNLGNGLIDGNWRLWFIDCSRCFDTTEDLIYGTAITHCERSTWESLRGLDREKARAELDPYLSPGEIDAFFTRCDKLIEHIEGLIDEWGEAIVLFDQRPPSVKAPWAR